MLRGGIRKRDVRTIAAVMGIAVIIVGGFVFTGDAQNRQDLEQAVIAENYLEAGNYEQAAEAYEQALSVRGCDEELLTIGMADAYSGLHDYEKALEVLRSYYQRTSGIKVKEKIEEIISAKTDYEYSQSVLHAEIYFTNQEYNKAIEAFEKAKQIKSKDSTAYRRIAEAYTRLGEYDLATEEIAEGLEITQDDKLELTLEEIHSCMNQEDYMELLEQASGYILQENYEEGIAKYSEAIALLPKESEAYEELAGIYLDQKEYDKAVALLQEGADLTKDGGLAELLSQVTQEESLRTEVNSILSTLSQALKSRNTTAVSVIMNTDFFKEEIASDSPVYYNFEEKDSVNGKGLVIYDAYNVYYGDIKDNVREGSGLYFLLIEGNPEPGYCYYDGEWKKNLPNGAGETMEMKVLTDTEDQAYISKIQTEGTFTDALEDGRMMKSFYTQGEEAKSLSYTAERGVPLPLTGDVEQSVPTPQLDSYVIGILSLEEEQTKEFYRVEPQTIWGVKPFIR